MEATMTASNASLLHLSTSEPTLKRRTPSGGLNQTTLTSRVEECSTVVKTEDPPPASFGAEAHREMPENSEKHSAMCSDLGNGETVKDKDELNNENKEKTSSSESLCDVPLKATAFRHLKQKYLGELEYMLREFQKLERQLLGAKTMQTNESAGSRERREKLHAFILHLEDTIQQIQSGCDLEAGGKCTIAVSLESTSLVKPTREKEEEENVQKLEEHILANLLPVKVRLKKQLAAQQGARHNPAGMPVRGVVSDTTNDTSTTRSTATFMETAKRRPSQFGKPLGGGSSLTQKLHGQTLGSENRSQGHGVGHNSGTDANDGRKILFAGMAVGSNVDQMKSSLTAAGAAHRVVIQDRTLLEIAVRKRAHDDISDSEPNDEETSVTAPASTKVVAEPSSLEDDEVDTLQEKQPEDAISSHTATLAVACPETSNLVSEYPVLSLEENRRLRKRRRRKKRLLREQQQQQAQLQQLSSNNNKRKKASAGTTKKRGPRSVEYMCALCNEVYNSTCDYNPWWALSQHECPKCRKVQIPRIDISSPANAIEYHPALLAHADENAGGGASVTVPIQGSSVRASLSNDGNEASDIDDSDLSDEDGILSDESFESDESETDVLENLSPAEQAEFERFGAEYKGPKLSDISSARLLILMLHASTCPCRHVSSEHREVCKSVKWLMMHVRDCPGTTSTFDVCPFPWCRKVKHLLYHLVTCSEPALCPVCSPVGLSSKLRELRGLNEYRFQRKTSSFSEKEVLSQHNTPGSICQSMENTSSVDMEAVQEQPCIQEPTKTFAAQSAASPAPHSLTLTQPTSDSHSIGATFLNPNIVLPTAIVDAAVVADGVRSSSTEREDDGQPMCLELFRTDEKSPNQELDTARDEEYKSCIPVNEINPAIHKNDEHILTSSQEIQSYIKCEENIANGLELGLQMECCLSEANDALNGTENVSLNGQSHDFCLDICSDRRHPSQESFHSNLHASSGPEDSIWAEQTEESPILKLEEMSRIDCIGPAGVVKQSTLENLLQIPEKCLVRENLETPTIESDENITPKTLMIMTGDEILAGSTADPEHVTRRQHDDDFYSKNVTGSDGTMEAVEAPNGSAIQSAVHLSVVSTVPCEMDIKEDQIPLSKAHEPEISSEALRVQ